MQIKLVQRAHLSAKISDLTKTEFEKDMSDKINIETCKQFKNFEEMREIIDDYGENVTLHRTKIFQLFNSKILKQYKELREELYKKNNLKRPTEIIVFTDGFSFGATSFFIKGLQETGGAIIVGYKGNPKRYDIFDASQSASSFTQFEDSDVFQNLSLNGFKISGISFYQSFNYSYQEKNPIPREYTIFPVDERVNIYHKYNDSYYDEFIDNALDIFKKYNLNKKFNKNNLLLTYDPNDEKTCYVFDYDEHVHGGFQCGDNGEWSNLCVPYYCDIGYIFDTLNKKCIKDICTEDESDEEEEEEHKEEKEEESEEKEGEEEEKEEEKYEEEENNRNNDKIEPEKEDFPVYAIVLISVGVVLILIIVGIIIFKFVIGKNKINPDSIGPLSEGNREADVELAERN